MEYAATDVDNVTFTQRYLRANSALSGVGSYDPHARGFELEWERSLSDNAAMTLTYELSKDLETASKDHTYTLEMAYRF